MGLSCGGFLAALAPHALALDPARALTQYQRRSWGAEIGLTSAEILSVTQGSNGYLWLGTADGAVRFDGVRYKIFDRKSDPSADTSIVYGVREDSRRPGELILSTPNGACRLANGRIQPFPSPASSAARLPGTLRFYDRADGSSWFTTVRGLVRIDGDGKVTGPLEGTTGWPAEKIRTVCRDLGGRLWLGTAQGLYRQRGDGNDPRAPQFDPLPGWEGKAVDRLLQARSGGLWVASRDAGVGRLAPDGTFRSYPALAGCVVRVLLEDRSGMLWVGTDGCGVFRVPASDDAGNGPPPTALTAENGLIDNKVLDFCEDREGNLWIATQAGLQVLKDTRFVNYGRPEGLGSDYVLSLLEDQRGRFWMGHENGLGMLAPGADRASNYPLPPSPYPRSNNSVLSLARGDDDDTLLAGTNAGLMRWRAGSLEPLPLRDDLDRGVVHALCRDTVGNLWVGEDGVYQVRGGEVVAHLTTADGLAGGAVFALLVDRHNNLWVGTGGGLSRRTPDGKITTFPNSGTVRLEGTVMSLFEEPDGAGDLFAGTHGGLHRLHFAADGGVQISRYTMREGLFDNVAWGIQEDGRGSLWLASDKGVSRVALADIARFDRGEIHSIPHADYGVADGMRAHEGSSGQQPASCRDHLGRLWFATILGAAMVDPAHLSANSVPPPVYVEEFLANGKPVPMNATKTAGDGKNNPRPALAPGTQKLDFRYTALGLTNAEANRFRYWLEGFDADWTDAETERAAHYTNLPPGDYRFHVQAASYDGVWNTLGATMAFRLRPFFYQTHWFRALIVGIALVLLGILLHGLRRRWQRRLADAEAKLHERERTAEILRQSKEQAEQAHGVAEQARQDAEAAQGQAEAAQEQAETARAEAERANAAKTEFLSRMSHELRTPLNAILGFGQLLELDPLPAMQGECVGQILSGGRHLLNLVDEILDISRVASGRTTVRMEDVELAPLLEEILGLIEPLARDRGVSLNVESEPRAVHLQADRQRLKQVILNLLANAIKYNRPVGGEVNVEVQARGGPEPDAAPRERILIRDNGSGIDPVGVAKLFTPFERLNAAYGPIRGTGLGLTISKQLVEAMGGTIGVESTQGLGSTFWVEFMASPDSMAQAAPPAVSRTQAMRHDHEAASDYHR